MTTFMEPSLDVLVVEDDHDTADPTATLLTWEGHQVRVAHNGADAIAIAQVRRPDVAILDIGLPGMNGLEVASALSRKVEGRRPFLVVVSGYPPEHAPRPDGTCIDVVLTKPVEPGVLTGVLKRFQHILAQGMVRMQ